MNELLDPKNRPALDELTGWYNSTIKPTAQLSDPAQRLKKVYDTVMAGQFSSAVQDFPGSRISTKELVADAPSKSTMGLVQSTPDLIKATEDYQQQIAGSPAAIWPGRRNSWVVCPTRTTTKSTRFISLAATSGRRFSTGRGRTLRSRRRRTRSTCRAGRKFVLPDGSGKIAYAVHDPSDVARLPHGAKFIIPDGSGRIGTRHERRSLGQIRQPGR